MTDTTHPMLRVLHPEDQSLLITHLIEELDLNSDRLAVRLLHSQWLADLLESSRALGFLAGYSKGKTEGLTESKRPSEVTGGGFSAADDIRGAWYRE